LVRSLRRIGLVFVLALGGPLVGGGPAEQPTNLRKQGRLRQFSREEEPSKIRSEDGREPVALSAFLRRSAGHLWPHLRHLRWPDDPLCPVLPLRDHHLMTDLLARCRVELEAAIEGRKR
jgi:hypothetical protein